MNDGQREHISAQSAASSLGQGGDEPERYRRVVALDPSADDALAALMAGLADPSWRVRKAAENRAGQMRQVPGVVAALIEGLAAGDNAGLRSSSAEALVRLGAAAAPELANKLDSDDEDLRKFVVEVLGHIGGPVARDALVAALRDSDSNVRTSAVDALGRIGDADAVGVLRDELGRTDTDVQAAAYLMDALYTADARVSFADLEPWLERPELERFVLPLLGRSGDPQASAALLHGLQSRARGRRRAAVDGLACLVAAVDAAGALRVRDAIAAHDISSSLRDAALDDDESVAKAALQVMAWLGEPALAPVLIEAGAERPFVDDAVQVVVRMGPAALEELWRHFDALGLEARILVTDVAAQLGSVADTQRLLHIARGPENRLAEAAIRALGQVGTEEAADALMDLLRHGQGELRRHLTMALCEIANRHPEVVAEQARAAWQAGAERAEWLVLLGEVGREQDTPLIETALHHSEPPIRQAAAEAARGFGPVIDEEALVFALADEHPRVREAAARALAAHDTAAALDALLVAIRDPDRWVVVAAIDALGEKSEPRAVRALVTAAESDSGPVAIAAIQALARAGADGLGAVLEKALSHTDSEVAREAVSACGMLAGPEAVALLMRALHHGAWSVRRGAAVALLRRNAPVAAAAISDRLSEETEPLVSEVLEALLERASDTA